MAEYVQDDRRNLDPATNPDPVTYHDSCNLGRNAALLEEPRMTLNAAVRDSREMSPNRIESYCCNGGAVAIP